MKGETFACLHINFVFSPHGHSAEWVMSNFSFSGELFIQSLPPVKSHIFDLDVLTNIYRYPPRVSVSERHGKLGSKDGVQIWNRSQHFKIKVTNLRRRSQACSDGAGPHESVHRQVSKGGESFQRYFKGRLR